MTETLPSTVEAEKAKQEAQLELYRYSGESFKDLLEGADFVKGFRLVTCEELVGEPFVITGVHFYPGLGVAGDFAAVQAVTSKDEPVVFNDGSTGVRRQLVAYLTAKGLIDPGAGPESGNAGESRYDRGAKDWKAPKNADKIAYDEGFAIRFVAPRGLRTSDYEFTAENGATQPARTYYLG